MTTKLPGTSEQPVNKGLRGFGTIIVLYSWKNVSHVNKLKSLRIGIMKKRVLIADDDHYYRRLLVDTLDQYNYEIVTAIDGSDALKFITEHLFDLVILDFHLPQKKGDGIMKEMDERCIDVPVIVITADDSLKTERLIRSFGPAYLFVKPFDIKDLRKVVTKIFAQKEWRFS